MKNNKLITREELVKLDRELEMIPLTNDLMFKNVFTYDLEILKEFLILQTKLDLDPKETTITLLNTELPKENMKEYKKTIDIYVVLNDKVNINVELNDSSFNEVLSLRNGMYESKLYSMLLEKGEKPEDLVNRKLIQLNLNTKDASVKYGEDILVTYGIKTGNFYLKNKQTILKYLAYYKNLYYNFDINLSKSELWLVVILSKNFTELYDLLENLLTNEKREKFIRKVMDMSKDTFILSEWEKDKMDRLKELARLEDAKIEGHEAGYSEGHSSGYSEGLEQGIQENKKEIVLNMFANGLSLEMIAKCTNLTIQKINKILSENSDK